MALHHFELLGEPVDVVHVIVFALGVLRLGVVSATTGEVGRILVGRAGQRAVRDTVAVDIGVTAEAAQAVEISASGVESPRGAGTQAHVRDQRVRNTLAAQTGYRACLGESWPRFSEQLHRIG